MPQPGNLAVGPMALMLRGRGGNLPVMHRTMSDHTKGPVTLWGSPVGPVFAYTATNWPSATWYLEAAIRSTSSKAQAQLYDVTTGLAVANSSVTVDANANGILTVPTRVRSVAITLIDGHEYRVQFGTKEGGAGAYVGASLIAIAPAITHAFVSVVADGADATLVRPTNWNAAHVGTVLEQQTTLIAISTETSI